MCKFLLVLLTCNTLIPAVIYGAPDPPTNLSVQVQGGDQAVITWSPPLKGHYSSYKLKVLLLNEHTTAAASNAARNINVEDNLSQHTLKELNAGASYQVQAYTVYDGKESVAYTSRNFTTKPNTPAKFIVWYRNETTLRLVWQPPYSAGTFSHYRVSIEPPDAHDSVFYVEKEEGSPGQVDFKGLVPGRAYNISLQTISEDEVSTPITSLYRTLPLSPINVTIDKPHATSSSFKVSWEPPSGQSEIDKYQVTITSLRQLQPVLRSREELALSWEFKEQLEAGKTYQVTVSTISGKVSSWRVAVDVTLKPLPVQNLKSHVHEENGIVVVSWTSSNMSTQDSYKVSYREVESTGDSSTVMTDNTDIPLESLLPRRNYSIMVQSVSNEVESDESVIYVTLLPSGVI